MKIVYRPHLQKRIIQRRIPSHYPRKIFRSAERRFFDTRTGHMIAVAQLTYLGKLRTLAMSYDILQECVEIVTIHAISEQEIVNKVKAGRWDPDENKEEGLL